MSNFLAWWGWILLLILKIVGGLLGFLLVLGVFVCWPATVLFNDGINKARPRWRVLAGIYLFFLITGGIALFLSATQKGIEQENAKAKEEYSYRSQLTDCMNERDRLNRENLELKAKVTPEAEAP